MWPLLSNPYENVRDEVKRKCDVISATVIDKVSLKLASKNLVRSKLKLRFKIFSVLF